MSTLEIANKLKQEALDGELEVIDKYREGIKYALQEINKIQNGTYDLHFIKVAKGEFYIKTS